jgi:hypothetical protein
MVVRLRLGKRPKPAARRARNRRFALGIATLLKPAALMAVALGIWGVGADLKLASSFAIASGLLSHWGLWLGTAVVLQVCSFALNRYGQNEALSPPKASQAGVARRAQRSERAPSGLP